MALPRLVVALAMLSSAVALQVPRVALKTPAPIQAAPAAAAAAAALLPTAAHAEIGFTEEALGVALGIAPLALIAAVVVGGALSVFGPSIEKAARMKRQLNIEYSAQKRFQPKDYL
mmetsp:Transcript_12978/g.38633  ORF Transcript_12978/g.38633 Transcript_12978/m.38633 type:complete len:116 (-) Transcript_12978:51-398(-)